MLTQVHPKLPMRNKAITLQFYTQLGFKEWGNTGYDYYLMIEKDLIQLHFFEFKTLDPNENYGQVYIRTNDIEKLYEDVQADGVAIHPAGHLSMKPWGLKEFTILDPDHNLVTFGEDVGNN